MAADSTVSFVPTSVSVVPSCSKCAFVESTFCDAAAPNSTACCFSLSYSSSLFVIWRWRFLNSVTSAADSSPTLPEYFSYACW